MNNLSILNAKRIVIKIGSSLLFSNNKFNSKWLDTFIEDVILLRKKNIDILIVASGSVSLGKIYLNIEKKVDTIVLYQVVEERIVLIQLIF